MDIYCKRGQKVRYRYILNPSKHYRADRPERHLIIERVYTVHQVNLSNLTDTVELEEKPGLQFPCEAFADH